MTASLPAALAVALSAAVGWLLSAHARASDRLAALCSLLGVSGRRGWAAAGQDYGPRVRGTLVGLQRRWRRTSERCRRRTGVTELCFALSAELQAGRTPTEGLERSVEVLAADFARELSGVLAAAGTGGDVSRELRFVSGRDGAEGLRRLAACWQVCAGSGAGFAVAVGRLAAALRAEEEHRQEVSTHLAGTTSTSRLLALLPLVGLLMSAGMGMDPFGFLLGTRYGLVCLAAGAVLDALGVLWTGRLARAAVEQR